MSNYYEILGVNRDASPETIRRAFRERAKERHPDKAAGSEAEMVRLNQAYETLKDPKRRREYDASLSPNASAFGAPGWPGSPRPARPKPRSAPGPDPLHFLMQVFQPLDQKLARTQADLDEAIEELAYDLYDDAYVARFEKAVLQTERLVTGLDVVLQRSDWPAPFLNAFTLYSQGIRQIEDALADFREFSQNYDLDLLVQGRAILDAAAELLDEAREGMDVR